MKTKLLSILVLLSGLLLLSAKLQAATVILDDSQSASLEPQLPMQWRSISPKAGDHQVVGSLQVQIRLNTQDWLGKTGRIYMALPAQPSGVVQAQWLTRGVFMPGQLQSGSRAQVWAGKIDAAMMEDVMTVTITTDGRLLPATQALRFHFELDTP